MNGVIILIPVYNDAGDLLKTLDSINESECIFEVLIIDDGSEHPLAIAIDNYSFDINIHRLEKNQGITKALNIGLDIISRRKDIFYIARLDAGDIQQPNRLSTQLQAFKKDPQLVMVGTNVRFFGVNKEHIFDTNLPLTDQSIKKNKFLKSCFIHPSVIFTRKVIDDGLRYSVDYPAAEDYEFFLQIITKYKVANIEHIYLYCFDRANGISISRRKVQVDSVLKCLIRHNSLLSKEWHMGMIKVISQKFLPRYLFNFIKSKLL